MEIEEKLSEIEATADELHDLHREKQRMHLWSLSVNILSLFVVCLSPFKRIQSYLPCINYVGVSAIFLRALYQHRKQHKICEKVRMSIETRRDIDVMLNSRLGINYNDVNLSSDECHETLNESHVHPTDSIPLTDYPGKYLWLLVIGQQLLNLYSLKYLKQPEHFRPLNISDDVRNASSFCNSIIILTETFKFKRLKGLLLKHTTSKEEFTKAAKIVNARSCKMKEIQEGLMKSNLQNGLIGCSTSDKNLKLQIKLVINKNETEAFNREINTIIQNTYYCRHVLSSKDFNTLTELVQNSATNGSDLLENLYNIKPQIENIQEVANVDMTLNPVQKETLICDLTALLENVKTAVSTSTSLKQCSLQLNSRNTSRLHLNQLKTKLTALKEDEFSVDSAAKRAIRYEIIRSRSNAGVNLTAFVNLKWLPLWWTAVRSFESAYETLKMTTGAIAERNEVVENGCVISDNLIKDTLENDLTAMAEETLKIYCKTAAEMKKSEFVGSLTTGENALSEALQTMSKKAEEVAGQVNVKLPSVELTSFDKVCSYWVLLNKYQLGISIFNICVDLLCCFKIGKVGSWEILEARTLKDYVKSRRRRIEFEK